jgi:AcrR family transcriptional regulator
MICSRTIGVVPRCTKAFPVRYSVVPDKTRVPYSTEGASSVTSVTSVTSVAGDAVLDHIDPFRLRLLDGLASSINERGYRATTVADIVRHARTSKRTFYDHFAGKEQCFIDLLRADVEKLGDSIQGAVDPDADWHHQIRQAVEAYVGYIESRPAITLSWIRELPSLGAVARPLQRRGLQLLSNLLIDLSASPGFRRADLPPLTAPLAVILLGGLRELTALAVEDGRAVREVVEPAVDASIALLGPRQRW